ncbi:hypothetical protein DesLBE_2610 [Desulfitobacterium sp. LBE]|uniref:Uncharacterized protein n=3 Tax=root TaxID=1 RepID=A0A098AW19_DESHA|nr:MULTISPECIES: hypothetical protein [Desulfitobacterium]EHL08824.1 hypothetical protein HMPREF0322_00467 [Desulfitobacterium hafniense DP7]KTE89169.1 hypothetical protein AT727_14180 [Desulfitobacterium hafniense]MEA5024350.1 hypothetical protein [Desulfitobacterium hafniense]TWH58297.1 hypothetical protein DesLBE_2610 [Desulfitobacterium sp. LBE]CDX00804.1 Hypothetical protein DPCES_0917 [Desulfitobacterium hafniense]
MQKSRAGQAVEGTLGGEVMPKKEFALPYKQTKDTVVNAPKKCPNCGALCASTMKVCTKCKTDLTTEDSGDHSAQG